MAPQNKQETLSFSVNSSSPNLISSRKIEYSTCLKTTQEIRPGPNSSSVAFLSPENYNAAEQRLIFFEEHNEQA